MFQYQRLSDLFHYIYSRQIIVPDKLAKQLNVSVRTIRSDINAINEELFNHGANISLKRNKGYSLDIIDDHKFQQFLKQKSSHSSLNLETPKNRIRYITQLLLTHDEYISINELESTIFVSYTTIQNYIRTIHKNLEEYNLELLNRLDLGVKIIGDEKSKRKCIIDLLEDTDKVDDLSSFSKEESYFFKDYDLDTLKSEILSLLRKSDFYINDINLKNLTLHIVLMILRISHENYINYTQLHMINDSYIPVLQDMITFLETTYDIYITEGERQYIYLHLVSNTNCNITELSDSKIYSLVENLLECIYQDYHFNLRDDVILVEDLMNHFKSVLSIKDLKIEKKNPLLGVIKSNFPLPYEITLTSVNKTLNQFNFTEDDIGYIALHIGASIERCFNSQFNAKNIILVCDGSRSTARIAEAQIKNYFGNKLNILQIKTRCQIESMDTLSLHDIDFIISTTTINVSLLPVVTINFALQMPDIEKISKMLNAINSKDHQKNLNFFDENLFILNQPYDNKTDLLCDMTDMLLSNHFINKNCLKNVLKREKLGKTNISDIFAFPHPVNFYGKETKAVVALLDEPLLWNDDETVQIVFLLITKEDDKKNIDKLYNIMVEIINNPSLQKKLLKSKNYSEFIDILLHI